MPRRYGVSHGKLDPFYIPSMGLKKPVDELHFVVTKISRGGEEFPLYGSRKSAAIKAPSIVPVLIILVHSLVSEISEDPSNK